MRISQFYQVETSGKSQVPLLRRVNLLMTIVENSCLFQLAGAYDVVVTAGTFMPNHIESAAVKEMVRLIRPSL